MGVSLVRTDGHGQLMQAAEGGGTGQHGMGRC